MQQQGKPIWPGFMKMPVRGLQKKMKTTRQACLAVLHENSSQRLAEEYEITRQARLAILQENASHRRAEEDEQMDATFCI